MRDRDKKRDEWLEKESCEIKARPEAPSDFVSLVQEYYMCECVCMYMLPTDVFWAVFWPWPA